LYVILIFIDNIAFLSFTRVMGYTFFFVNTQVDTLYKGFSFRLFESSVDE